MGFYNNLLKELEFEDQSLYKNFLRMDLHSFNLLLALVSPIIDKKDTFMREAIHAGQRLAITLRFLATGNFRKYCYEA